MGGNEYSANSAFATSIALETVNIGENVTNIPDYAFYNCTRLASITFPNSVTGIGEKAFYSTAISELTIVSSVERIGNNAFEHCTNLTTVNFNATNCTTAGNLVFLLDDAFTTLNIGQNVTRIPSYLFSGCAITSDLTIPNFVTIIGSGAFANCNGLTSVNIGNSVTSIGSSAFKDCTGLSGALTIPNSVTSIGGAAFQNCSGFTSLTLGSSVAEISMNAFAACTGISIIYSLATTPPTLSSFAFVNMDTNIPVIVPCGCVSAYNDAWSGFNNIQQSNDCPSYTITVTSANSSQGTVTGGGTYVVGSVITIEAIANDGFQFSSWNDGNTDNPRQITVTGNATYTASFIPVTAIAENSATRIFIYPNPASSTINITSPETISSIEIENVLGQVVKRVDVNSDNASCDVSELPNGIYMMKIRVQGDDIKLKFVKE